MELESITIRAIEIARKCHEGQKRKYTNEPYILHPVRVAFMLAELHMDEETLAAAILHDVLEDSDITQQELLDKVGPRVTRYVVDVSNLHRGNRKTRKLFYREQLGGATTEVQTIKLADMLDNCPTIIKHDPDFAKVYMREQKQQLPYLRGGHVSLYLKMKQLIEDYFK